MRHYDPWLDLPENRRMSEVFRHHDNTTRPHTFTRSLFDSTGLSYADHSFRAFSWNGRLIFGWGAVSMADAVRGPPEIHKAEGYSDHLPVMLKIRKGPFHPDTLPNPMQTTSHNSLAREKRGDLKAGSKDGRRVLPILLAPRHGARTLGKYCLRISGQAGKQNVCAARAIIQCARQADSLETCWQCAARAGNVFLQGAGPRE